MTVTKFESHTAAYIAGILWAAEMIKGPTILARAVHDCATPASDRFPTFIGMMGSRSLLLAHAAELAMKLVLQQSDRATKATRRTHDLGILFRALPLDVRSFAESAWLAHSEHHGGSLEDLLVSMGDASSKLRYLTEGTNGMGRRVESFPAMESVAQSMLGTIQGDGTIWVPR